MYWTYLILVAGVLGGGFLVYIVKPENRNILRLLLAFSGAFLIGITFLILVPEVFREPVPSLGLFVLLGFLLQLVLELLTHGAEHGHEHDTEHCDRGTHISPFLLMTGLCIHAFLEGAPIIPSIDTGTRNMLVMGIIVHNIPISLTLIILFIHYGMKRGRAALLLIIFSLMTPLGSILSQFLQEVTLQDISYYLNYVMAVVIGIFLHVSTSILFETEENHQVNLRKFMTVILGLALAFGVSFLGHGQ